jgi:Ca2+-binding EF-hand superfamily protein
VVEFDVNTAAETPRQQGILKTPKTTAETPQQGILKNPKPPREDAPQSSKKPAVTVTPRQSSSCKSEAVTPRQSEAGSGSQVTASDSCTSEAVTQRQSSSAATPRQSAAAAPRQISSKHASPQRRQEDASKPSQKPEKNSPSFVSNVPLFPIIVSQKNRKLVRLEALKDLVQSKFTSVYDAFVFFDFMKVNYVSMKNLMRGLVKLGADDLVNDFASLVRDLEWKCQDHGMIHCGEFFQLLAWHPLNDFIKELAAARLAYDRKKRAEQNKSISIKVPREQKPTPLCDKLREVLKTKYRSVAGFMVVANMDVKDVISFLELNTAFRLEGIEGIDIEALATELSDPSFPPTAIKTFSFQNSLRWHSLEEVEAMITEERLSFFVERNQLEKGLPQIPLPPTAVPFFREHPEVDKAKSIMQKHFENAADAFVWFDTDNSGEITRVKMAHGLQRLQNMEGGDITLDIDKLMPELQNLRFTGGCIDAVGFIWNFRWHEKFPDIAEAVLIARRKKMEKAAIIEPQKKGRGGKFGFKIKNQNKLLYTVTRNQGKELPVILGGTVSMDEWLRKKELNVTLSKIASIRLSVEPKKGVSDVSDDLQEPTVITLTGGNSRNLEHAGWSLNLP